MVEESKEDLMAAYKLDPNNKNVRKELQNLKVKRASCSTILWRKSEVLIHGLTMCFRIFVISPCAWG